MEVIRNLLPKGLILLIRFYRFFISPLMGQNCRFYPSCSQYVQEALEQYPFFTAMKWSIYRLCRCHPWCQGGLDPLPKQQNDLAKKVDL